MERGVVRWSGVEVRDGEVKMSDGEVKMRAESGVVSGMTWRE